MRTDKQREASRRNGARSLGPSTPAGKRKSAANSVRHGFYSKTIHPAETPEEIEDFEADRAALADEFHPRTTTEHALVEIAVRARRDWSRALQLETDLFSEEIERQRLAHPEAPANLLTLLAFQRLIEETTRLEAIHHFQSASNRRWERAIQKLYRSEILGTNPAPSAAAQQFCGTNPTTA